MPGAITDLIDRVTDSTTGRPVISALASPKALAAVSLQLTDVTNWTTTTAIHFVIYEKTAAGVKDPTTQTDWKGTLTGTTITNLTLTGGTDRAYNAGAVVELAPTARWAKDLYDLVSSGFNQDGTARTSWLQQGLNIGTVPADYTPLANPPSAVVANGNRSYTLTFAGVDYSNLLSPGQRLRTTRTVAAPTQSTSLNGTNQYFSKTAPAGMTFTDDFVVSAWVKLSSYANSTIISRFNGTSGWTLRVRSSGTVYLAAHNAASGNFSYVETYQSLPLNKWVHVTAQLDMSAFTATTTTSYFMIDGVDVPSSVSRGGTNPTALIQAGNLEVGSENAGTNLFPGKIAQVAIFSAKVTQATMRGYMSQGLTGTETSLISAYSFNNTLNDLNTTNANNLTANNGAVATNADSPFGGQAGGTISSTVDYAIVQAVSYSSPNTTVTVQVPEGCTIPTSGGVSATSYSSVKAPYGMPVQKDKWTLRMLNKTDNPVGGVAHTAATNMNSSKLTLPVGEWGLLFKGGMVVVPASGTTSKGVISVSTSTTTINADMSTYQETQGGVILGTPHTIPGSVSVTTETPYYVLVQNLSGVSATIYPSGIAATHILAAENAYL